MYIIANINNQGSEYKYTTYEEVNHNRDWGQEFVIVELLHIVETIQQIIIEDLSTSNMLENDKHYYVDMI